MNDAMLCRRCWFALPSAMMPDAVCSKCGAATWIVWPRQGLDIRIAIRLAVKMPKPLGDWVIEDAIRLLAKFSRAERARVSVGYLARNAVS
jgi:hypothetical protein